MFYVFKRLNLSFIFAKFILATKKCCNFTLELSCLGSRRFSQMKTQISRRLAEIVSCHLRKSAVKSVKICEKL